MPPPRVEEAGHALEVPRHPELLGPKLRVKPEVLKAAVSGSSQLLLSDLLSVDTRCFGQCHLAVR
jgi:hypothetical protein